MRDNAWEWTEQDLLELIRLGAQESLTLDYKQSDALQTSDGRKNEISKDVSAFANSAGGTIIYGMRENGHVPTELDKGLDPSQISKEWLEQVINSRVQRRIDGVRVNQVPLTTTAPGRVAYVVCIPASTHAPHQASDKRFYKRFNFESVPMEEYEIRDVANRTTAPALDVEFKFRPGSSAATLRIQDAHYFAPVGLAAVLSNQAQAVAECAVIHLLIDDRIKITSAGPDVRAGDSSESIELEGKKATLKQLTTLWDRTRGLPIFKGMTADLPASPLQIAIPRSPQLFALKYIIGSPGMESRFDWVFLSVDAGKATFIRPTSSEDSSGSAVAA